MKAEHQEKETGKLHKSIPMLKGIRGRMRMQVLILLFGVLLLAGITFAWYTWRERAADSKEVEVMEPYYLYLRDKNDAEMVRLAVDSLFPGETKTIYFCVSNGPNEENESIGTMGGGDFDYTMELIYTQNLPLNFSLFELGDSFSEGTGNEGLLTPTDVSGERYKEVFGDDMSVAGIVNKGKYQSYVTGKDGNKLHLSTGKGNDGKDVYMSRFFRMEISCTADTFDQYRKETDMIYLLVKAEQPEPVKIGTP